MYRQVGSKTLIYGKKQNPEEFRIIYCFLKASFQPASARQILVF